MVIGLQFTFIIIHIKYNDLTCIEDVLQLPLQDMGQRHLTPVSDIRSLKPNRRFHQLPNSVHNHRFFKKIMGFFFFILELYSKYVKSKYIYIYFECLIHMLR